MVGDDRPTAPPVVSGTDAGQNDPFGGLATGTQVGKYEIVEILGQGGFGITYRARDTQLRRNVAIKEYLPTSFAVRRGDSMVLPRSTQTADDFLWGRTRFLEEARTLATFEEAPGIVNVYDFMEANGTAYMVMALVRGETLEARLKRDRRLPQPAIELLLYPLLDGLELVHEAGFLHRDIKPANILIDSSGRPTLIDFGASRMALQGRTQAMTAVYTPAYAAFEQMGSGKQGPWTDIYALAGTLYHCVAGAPPPGVLDRMTEDTLVPAAEAGKGRYAPSLLAAIDAGLKLKAAERPQSIADWRRTLSGLAGATLGAPTRDMGEPRTRRMEEAPARRRPALAWIAAGIVVLALAGGGAWLVLRPPPETVEEALRRADEETRRHAAVATKLRQEQEAAAEAQRKAQAEVARKAAEEKEAADVAARRQADEAERQRVAVAEAQRRAQAEAARQAGEEKVATDAARKSAEERDAAQIAARRRAEDDARAQAEAARLRRDDEIRREAEARVREEYEARRRAEEEARIRAEAEAVARRREEEKVRAEAASRDKAEADARRKAEDEARRATDDKAKAEADAKRQAEAAEAALRLPDTDRKRVQVALTSLGFDTRGSDGSFGARTRQMIAAWQKKQGAPETGYLTALQVAALRQQAAPAMARFDEEQKKAEEDKRKAEDDAKKRADEEKRPQPPASAPPSVAATPSTAPSSTGGVDGNWSGSLRCDSMLPRDDPVTLTVSNGRGLFRRNPLELTVALRGDVVRVSVVSATQNGVSVQGELNGRLSGTTMDADGTVRSSIGMLGSTRCMLRLTKQ